MEITGKEFEAYGRENDILSDIDMGFNHSNGLYDIPSIEWDGPYGRHWSRYIDEAARTEALDQYDTHINVWVAKYRKDLDTIYKEKLDEIKRLRNLTTLGGRYPELAEVYAKIK